MPFPTLRPDDFFRRAQLRRAAAAAALLLPACVDRGGEERAGGALPVRTDTLAATVLSDDERLSRPATLSVVGEWVLVGDVPRPHALHVLSRGDGRHLAAWGREGEGPGEFQRIWGIQPGKGGGDAWLFDPGLSRMSHVDVHALASGAEGVLRGMLKLTGEVVPMAAVWSGDSVVVAAGMFSGGRLARFDRTGRSLGTMGPLPPGDVPGAVSQHAYSGTLVQNAAGTRFGLLTRHADRFEIYTADGSLVRVAQRPRGFEPRYEAQLRGGQPVMVSGDDLRFGYVEGATAGEHVYALYSGLLRGELPGRANLGGEVHVFDWEGTLLRIHPLDRRALAIAVAPDERTLYTVVHEPEPAVLRYTLP